MADFSISPASLRRSSDGIDEVVGRLGQAITKLETTTTGLGEPWGTGLVGQVLGEIYLGIKDLAIGSYEANGEVMSEYAERLHVMADELQEHEAEIESGLVDFGSQLGQSFRKTGP